MELAFAHDEKILVEEFLDGVEVECSVLGNADPIASVPGEIVPLASDWYDYEAKYAEGGMELVVPPRVSAESAARVQELAVASFVASDCEGMARVDLLRPAGRRGRRQRAEHDPRLHRHERLREALRGVRHPVPGAARPPGRARPRAARPPRPAPLLSCPDQPAVKARTSFTCALPSSSVIQTT